ncbi:LacI family DNA-binding transcriptional regulator [Macrococcoides canis]|uniref:LacI family transcriptional regulator n=1 Tax=Macrococcoides canis TaxID=1855823 RepID=A0A4R6C5E1_9STAP|nr:LacI family DNA-binding transcriptional regulator [Macrococcus canis]TDM17227.1 LacI family transcriptional regulator [Macrococcus canis]TDM20559.1 LacI family transcriptional regulator [Macrococcus canis]TDM22249.1 LacI family transcriptional regulator [Macrococcus canis]TDM32152.1 LacI family transcriptional regulator [Macrococcus canis]TDM33036.1 LacI family transcriptional regulator [Macrococcus canis]
MNIHDIAKIAGVSKSTVSRYLNGGSISTKTRDKIERVVIETGYAPNQFAQSLKAKRTQMIGVIVPRLNSFASNETLLGIETYLRQQHYQTIIVNTDLDVTLEINALYSLAKNKVDGILLFATQITEEHIKAFETVKTPVILVGQSYKDIHSIVQNDYEAGLAIGEYFGKTSLSRIAYLGVGAYDKAVGIHRKNGVLEGLKQFDKVADYYETTFKLSDAKERAKTLLSDYEAIICATDNIALGVLKAAYELSLKVPEQLSISGFGGYETTSIVTPMITTVAFPYQKTGECAAVSMLALLDGKDVPYLQHMDFQILEKESVDISRT